MKKHLWLFICTREDKKYQFTESYPFASESLSRLKKQIQKHYLETTPKNRQDFLVFNKEIYRSVTEKYNQDVFGWIKKVAVV